MKISSFMNLLHSTINGYIFSKFAVPRSWAQSARSQSEDVKTRRVNQDYTLSFLSKSKLQVVD